jgi:hypothetical protein
MLRAFVDRRRIFRRLNLGSKRELSPLPFPVRENAVVDRSPIAAGRLVLARVQVLHGN